MRRRVGIWLFALLVTLSSAIYQRLTGPTRPARGTVMLGESDVKLRLLRSWAGAGDLAVTVKAPDPKVTGSVAWRRYPTNDAFAALRPGVGFGPFVREARREPAWRPALLAWRTPRQVKVWTPASVTPIA